MWAQPVCARSFADALATTSGLILNLDLVHFDRPAVPNYDLFTKDSWLVDPRPFAMQYTRHSAA
jgi:hypothetical protein